ncbi:cysteine dioxygenase [Paenibacillus sp. HJGM_3]|uniref:cysteine dioxygenase n=1 Tax=Paenibacillus sp. HJGM_3 TaxID=3379816 RepID=UPI00385BA255
MTRMSECISPVIHSIGEPTCEQLIDALMSLKAHKRLLSEEIPMPGELPYGRKVLYANEELEVILVHLPPYASTRIHDHGDSIGAALVLEGQLVNALYRLEEGGEALEQEARLAHCEELFLAERNQVHQMRNPYPERVVSLHMYAPPLRGMQVYE